MDKDRYHKHYRGAKVDRVVIIGATMGLLACLVAIWDSEGKPSGSAARVANFTEVMDYQWKRTAFVEEYRETKDAGWKVPGAGEVISQETRVREQEIVPVMVGQIIPELNQRCGIPLESGETVTTQCAVNGDSVYFVRDQKVWEQRPITDTWYTWVVRGWEVVDSVETQGSNSAPVMPKQPEVSEGQRVNCCHEVNLVEAATPEGPMMFNLVQGFDVNGVVQDRRININYLRPVEEGDDVARPPQSASEMLFEMYRDR